MDIACTCGRFRARLADFPRSTPGRLVCYCDDCQAYLRHLQRTDLLDEHGGTEVIPAYPADVQVVAGLEQLRCTRLTPKGLYRFSTTCCNTPIGNTRPGHPWVGLFHVAYEAAAPGQVAAQLGPVRSRVMGKFATGQPPAGTPDTFDGRALRAVMPFMLKGLLRRKSRPSPFFAADGQTPVVPAEVLSAEQAQAARRA